MLKNQLRYIAGLEAWQHKGRTREHVLLGTNRMLIRIQGRLGKILAMDGLQFHGALHRPPQTDLQGEISSLGPGHRHEPGKRQYLNGVSSDESTKQYTCMKWSRCRHVTARLKVWLNIAPLSSLGTSL